MAVAPFCEGKKMDYYHEGKYQLDLEKYAEARDCFLRGIGEGDDLCYYGLLAVAANTGVSCEEPLAQLEEVFPRLLEKAENGNSDACFVLGRCYETGSVVSPDMEKALRYYTRAANWNNCDAMFNLGCFYINRGERCQLIAVDYFTRAAEQGHMHAQVALGFYYEQQKDYQGALAWYERAMQNGNERIKAKVLILKNQIL